MKKTNIFLIIIILLVGLLLGGCSNHIITAKNVVNVPKNSTNSGNTANSNVAPPKPIPQNVSNSVNQSLTEVEATLDELSELDNLSNNINVTTS